VEDYSKLIKRLKTLPDTTTQSTMVPVGDIAFLPGKIVHTNEIMVLLGDNWFVERSAKQASEVADRRLKMVEKQLDDLVKEHEHIKSNLTYADQFSMDNETKEIKETVPEDYQSTKGKRKIAHKAKHNVVPRAVSFKNTDAAIKSLGKDLTTKNKDSVTGQSSTDQTIDHEELMSRLNELEREEQEAEQREHDKIMESIMEGSYVPPNGTDDNPRKSSVTNGAKRQPRRHVKFHNLENEPLSSEDEEERLIRFDHTNLPPLERSLSDSDLAKESTIKTPADIYEQFYCGSAHLSDSDDSKPLKSILKKDSRSGSSENLRLKPILKSSPEHRPGTPDNLQDEPQSILKTPPDTQASDKRPGTPEHVLDGPSPTPQSILKPGGFTKEEIPMVEDIDPSDSSEIRPILKSHETPPFIPPTATIPTYGDDNQPPSRPSILKHSTNADNSNPNTRSFSPEAAMAGDSNSIWRNDSNSPARSVRIVSPEPQHPNTSVNESFGEPRPILKAQPQHNPQSKMAFSGTIVERDTAEATSTTSRQNKPSSNKPMSKFKASRMKK